MKKFLARTLLIVPVLYAGIIVLLVLLQFSDDQGFSEQLGALTLRGRRALAIENQDQPITELRIQYSGLEFAFNSASAVRLDDGDGVETLLGVIGYSTLDDGFEVQLENEIRLQFLLTGERNDELHIRPQIADPIPGSSAITIPYATVGGAQARQTEAGETLPVQYNSRTFLLAPPPRSMVEGDALRLPADVQSQTVRYTALPDEREDVIERWFSDNRYAVADQTYEALLRAYIDRGYRGWRSSRFNPASGTWDMREGSPQFHELILTATLAEAWRRNEYAQAFGDMRRAADLHPGRVGLLSSPFLGNLREIKLQVQEEDDARTRQLLSAAARGDAELFRTHDLMSFAVHRGSTQLGEAVIELAAELDFRDLDLFQTVGLLYNAHVSDPILDRAAEVFSRFDAVIEERLFPAVIRAGEGFFLQSTAGQIDVRLSILAGMIMEHEGRRRPDRRLLNVGRNLVVSALSLADNEGFLPRVLIASSAGFQSSDGAVGPEELYPFLHDNPNYPRMVSLYDQLGPGAWIWTISAVSGIQISETEISFAVAGPINRTHHMIVQGIPPFNSMELFGLEWRNDPSFEAYARGRHYNSQTRTLLIKYTDTLAQRRLRLIY